MHVIIGDRFATRRGDVTYGNQPGGYSSAAKWLHWLVALSVLSTVPVAFGMNYVGAGPLQDRLYNVHKSIGVLILILMLLRIINRVVSGAPAPEPGLARWQRALSSAVHGLLYALLIIMPIVGMTANSIYGAPISFFGLFTIPPFTPQNEDLANQLFTIHRWIGWVIIALVVAHIGGALQHFIIERDGVLQRMLPRMLGGR
jgi:cytochrome b561